MDLGPLMPPRIALIMQRTSSLSPLPAGRQRNANPHIMHGNHEP